jgi:hypothetical protein
MRQYIDEAVKLKLTAKDFGWEKPEIPAVEVVVFRDGSGGGVYGPRLLVKEVGNVFIRPPTMNDFIREIKSKERCGHAVIGL